MKPENKSQHLLSVTRSKAKLFEYDVDEKYHINIIKNPASLFSLTIGLLGEISAHLNLDNQDDNYLKELRKNLHFSAHFFDAYLQTRLSTDMDNYLLLLGSASYYLCDLPGSSNVLVNRINSEKLELNCSNLDKMLNWLLIGDFSIKLDLTNQNYSGIIDLSDLIRKYYEFGTDEEEIYTLLSFFRKNAYQNGTSRELLFADVISALVKKRLENSSRKCLPKYSGIEIKEWEFVLKKKDFMKEFWPSQHLLGAQNLFKGQSAVVQLPTSAGKTKAIEILIRSAFLSNRTSLAVIVAPFKALCHEISNTLNENFREDSIYIDELSDILQIDFDISSILSKEIVMVVTPEKLLYMLRNFPDLAMSIGLLIYDEGHQFDNGARGATYELLLSSLKTLVSNSTQSVLISAVISNAEEVGDWLNGDENKVITGEDLSPTYRTVAFTSWLDHLGRLEFVNAENPEKGEFYLPRIIEEQQLQLKGKESKLRVFPEKKDSNSISLFLGLKLVSNGSVAIFCGTKVIASSMGEKIIDAFERGLIYKKPKDFCDEKEVKKLHFLYKCHLGSSEYVTKSASIGVFTHHGSIPHGIRLAVEHSMAEGLVQFVLCTSTLAQGVNLPIKYLIVTGLYQGSNRIKVRDFHNLIGRVGRSGKHTEGSIIFSDPGIYDKRTHRKENWRWEQVKEYLNQKNSEPCESSLLMIFDPFFSDNKKQHYKISFSNFMKAYFDNSIFEGLKYITTQFADQGFTIEGLERQTKLKIKAIEGIESYIMAHWEDFNNEIDEEKITLLAKGTLAYSLANQQLKQQLVDLFIILGKNISQNVPQDSRKKVFGKMLYGVRNAIEIEKWTKLNLSALEKCNSSDELLNVLWPLISENVQNNPFKKCDKPKILLNIASGWINGKSFAELFQILKINEAKMNGKKQKRNYKIEHVVELSENGFSYEGMLLIGAVTDIVESSLIQESEIIIERLKILQKSLKYGLPNISSIMFYELGFSDRIVSQELGYYIETLGPSPKNKRQLIKMMKKRTTEVAKIISQYPSYYTVVFNNLLN